MDVNEHTNSKLFCYFYEDYNADRTSCSLMFNSIAEDR